MILSTKSLQEIKRCWATGICIGPYYMRAELIGPMTMILCDEGLEEPTAIPVFVWKMDLASIDQNTFMPYSYVVIYYQDQYWAGHYDLDEGMQVRTRPDLWGLVELYADPIELEWIDARSHRS